MAKQDKLMKAFEAFVNNDIESATDHYRQFFIESAQKINAQLEENFGGDMEEDFTDEISVDEEDGMEDDFSDFEDEDDDFEDDFESDEDDESEDEDDAEVPSAEEWEKFEDAFEELEALFNEVSGGEMDDVVEESFDYSKVAQPSMQETDADNTASTTAKAQDTGPTGVKATDGWTKDGTVKGSNVKAEYPDSETPKVEDHNNVMPNGKNAYKKTKTPSMKETDVDNTHSTVKAYKK
ncbi:hypothetical protein NVP2275O_442 [Vibrio phage 2.275.O._10N.286.54.E11]|nr:hypothetical protein NVP2275O_442 [Vibrio phage 2.275.O._10N.286.54.E11]